MDTTDSFLLSSTIVLRLVPPIAAEEYDGGALCRRVDRTLIRNRPLVYNDEVLMILWTIDYSLFGRQ